MDIFIYEHEGKRSELFSIFFSHEVVVVTVVAGVAVLLVVGVIGISGGRLEINCCANC